jgi:hypothetical protein
MGNGYRIPGLTRAGLALATSLGLVGCSAATPTPQIVYLTPAPTPIIIYVTPPPTPTPAVTPSPVATPTPSPTDTPTPSPTPSPTSAAAACTGTADNKAFFAQAAGAMNWTVYCAVLPSGWSITKGSYKNAPAGLLEVDYQHGSQEFQLYEGNLCGLMSGMCGWKPIVADQGPGAFDHLAAELYTDGAIFIVDVGYGTEHEYLVFGLASNKTQLVAYAAAMRAVPK